jgi:hypothetical protein
MDENQFYACLQKTLHDMNVSKMVDGPEIEKLAIYHFREIGIDLYSTVIGDPKPLRSIGYPRSGWHGNTATFIVNINCPRESIVIVHIINPEPSTQFFYVSSITTSFVFEIENAHLLQSNKVEYVVTRIDDDVNIVYDIRECHIDPHMWRKMLSNALWQKQIEWTFRQYLLAPIREYEKLCTNVKQDRESPVIVGDPVHSTPKKFTISVTTCVPYVYIYACARNKHVHVNPPVNMIKDAQTVISIQCNIIDDNVPINDRQVLFFVIHDTQVWYCHLYFDNGVSADGEPDASAEDAPAT